MGRFARWFVMVTAALGFCRGATAEMWMVVSISDGDTITCLTEGKKQIKVRLNAIDAPENGQPYGFRAKKLLGDLVFRKVVEVRFKDKDRYDRLIGQVFLDGKGLGQEMLSATEVPDSACRNANAICSSEKCFFPIRKTHPFW